MGSIQSAVALIQDQRWGNPNDVFMGFFGKISLSLSRFQQIAWHHPIHV
jgi:hypothetical protein